MSAPTRFSFTAPFDLYAELQRLDRIAGAIGASTEIASNYDDAARELVSKLRGTVTEGQDPAGRWVAADDVNRLVREIDVALNGVDAAPQAKLCDITAQACKAAREGGPILPRLAARPKPAGAVPLPTPDRDAGGRVVREAWVRWALTQPDPKPSWLVPYDDLSEPDKEADRQIFEACAGRAPSADGVPAAWREFVTACANTGGVEVCGNRLSARAKSLLEPLPTNSATDERGKCAHCGVLCSIGAFIPDGRWVCSYDCHVLLRRAELECEDPRVSRVPEGWKITRNEVGGIRVEAHEGSWLSMPDTTPKNGNFSLEMRLLYGLAEALLDSPKSQFSEMKNFVRDWLSLPMGGYLKNADFGTPIAEFSLNTSPNQLVTDQASDEAAQDREPASASPRRVHAVRYGMDLKPCHCDAGKDHVAGAEVYSGMVDASHGADHAVSDTTAALIDMLRQRDAAGRAKYGVTLDRSDLSQAEWLQHMAEEMLDGAGYALAAIRTLKAGLALAPEAVVRARFESCAQGFHSRDYADGYLDALQHVASERQPPPTIQNGES